MSDWVVATAQAGHTRHFGVEALPVSIGGDADCDIVLADIDGSVQIGLLDDVFFAQPGRFTDNLRVGGELLRGSRRLADGDVISLDAARIGCALSEGRLRLNIEARITAGDTAPPDFDALAQDTSPEVTVSPIAFDPKAGRSSTTDRHISKAALVIYAAFVLLATLGWFAFTAKSVRFETEPVADSLELPGSWFRFRIDERYMLRPGQHRVVAKLDGYYDIDEVIDVTDSADQTVEFEFVKLPGLIAFATVPEAGAEVRVDGELIGTTPIEDYEVRPGTHQIQFSAERYLSELVTLEVEGGHERDRVRVELTPSWAPVSFSSRPPGAEIRVDGRLLGQTPAELELTAGDRELVVSLAGYNSVSRQIRVVADEPQALPEFVLSLADGRIALSSEPADATIYLDAEYVGRTPSELRLRPNVAHTLRLSKPGYESETLEFTLDPGERQTLSIELAEQLGVVEVTSSPEGAEVLVNGEPAGVTPVALSLMSVEQNVVVRLDGFADSAQSITPRPGYPQRLPFDLVPLDEASGGGYPRILTTGLGQNLRLIPAGRIRMGASRADSDALVREKDRYRQVEISRAFYLAEKEMTNAEYRHCEPGHDSGSFEGLTLNQDEQPVVNVTVQEIFACLNQLSIEDGLQPVYQEQNGVLAPQPERNGYRLPTEAEFALALRAAGRVDEEPLRFSWGQTPPPPDRVDNIADLSAREILEDTIVTYTDGYPVSAPTGSFPPNAAGLYDMGGNVAEWVQDFYDPLETFDDEVIVDPTGPATGRSNIVRGPSWRSATVRRLRLSYLEYEDDGREDIGFRVARNLE